MSVPRPDLSEMRPVWERRLRRVREVHRRYDPTGAARPERPAEEREWLARRGGLGPFVEVPVDEGLRQAFWNRNAPESPPAREL